MARRDWRVLLGRMESNKRDKARGRKKREELEAAGEVVRRDESLRGKTQ